MILPKKAADVSWALLRAISFETEHLAEITIPLGDPRRGKRVEALRLELRAVVDRALEANREVGQIQGRAVLSQRWLHWDTKHYTVLATCSLCNHAHRVVSSGWDALVCPGCKSGLFRGSYIGPNKTLKKRKASK